MAEMSRNELVQALLQMGVQYSRGAHVESLRLLYQGEPNANSPGNDFNAATDANVEGAIHVHAPENEDDAGNRIVLANEDAALDSEIRILQKRRRVAELRRALAEQGDSDAYDGNKWLNDFECTCASINGDDNFMLKSVRGLMKPDFDAELFLRTDSSSTYIEFREDFLKTFGHVYPVSEIIEKLNEIKFRPSDMSVMGYILQMQEIASRAKIDEKLIVR